MSPSICNVALALAFAATALSAVPGGYVGSGRLMDTLVGSQDYVGSCLAHYAVNYSDTCMSIVNLHPDTLSLNEFYKWNPQVESDCSNLVPGENVCLRADSRSFGNYLPAASGEHIMGSWLKVDEELR
ncbi:carbohydrate-binding module family 50 protein [Penicillium atrosanguineum]|uniref:Carbohydrate-binding module family 50 protein n=1 Tax=Penicillium atrosanguineum TaxID=1132637 RepID=A0A9W9GGP1_9EURO|nr:transcriptional regulator family: Fungal Specific TF [Penicillium atrosanguineum]KAJ5118838.1 carbohydrate-binding module family 50 protein [Penicillium atrosanguineum]KAJ5119875.1 carbohydrate-binding module family 50 protein [Penicillium atrosanguineum]KAJ5296875.1 transcriptional regulator family: Fungal Specific TF [Penicillium atrosanguineum]KAJ5299636.1 carbohydrate-binding module family 50 protein [Penicillium atrosanguineum]